MHIFCRQLGVVRLEQLIPEQSLKGVEVQAAVAQEVNLHVRCHQVLLVDTVHDKHIVLGELQACGLNEAECHELKTNHGVALHLQVTCERNVLLTHLYGELHL